MNMKKTSLLLTSLLIAFTLVAVPFSTSYASPVDVFENACANNSDPALCSGTDEGLFDVIRTVIQVMLIIGGIIAVIMIIIGGIKYMTSNGEQSHVKSAKDTILYAVIGLVVISIAFSLVTWVVGKL